MKKMYVLLLALMFTLVAGVTSVSADTNGFAGGDGSAENPYQIMTKAHLDNIRNYPDASFVLMKDIVFEDADFQAGGAFYNHEAIDYRLGWLTGYNNENKCDPLEAGWVPILKFNGHLDGNNHAIKNLCMTRYSFSISNYFGFIVENNGVIENLHLEDIYYCTGSSLGNGVGGIVSMNNGTIRNCVASGTLEPFATDCIVGGIASENSGRITGCVNLTNIYVRPACNLVMTGGITGRNNVGGIVENCVNIGSLGHGESKNQASGGISSVNQGEITCCYSFGSFSYPRIGGNGDGDYNPLYSDGTRFGLSGENIGTIKNSYACAQDVDGLIGNYGYNGNGFMDSGGIKGCAYIPLKDAYNRESYRGFDFQNTWTTDKLGLPYPAANTTFAGLNLDFSNVKKEVRNVSAQPNSYKSVSITWEKNEACDRYHLYLLKKGESDGYAYGTIPNPSNKGLYRLLAVINGDETAYIHQLSPNDKTRYTYALAPVWDIGGVFVEGVCSPITQSYVVDTNGERETPADTVAPVLNSMELLTEETYPPGEVKIRVDVADNDAGIASIKLGFVTEDKSTWFSLEKSLDGDSNITGTVSFSVPSGTSYGNYTLSHVILSDKEGNKHTYTGGYFDHPLLTVSKEFDVEFTGVLSNRYVAKELSNMEEGKTVVLTIDEASKGILKKEVLDAIKGKDKTLVVYNDDQGSLQWVFYGKDITEDTKDLNLNVKMKKVDGTAYGGKGSIIQLDYAKNGKLPGNINFRLKSNYIKSIHGLDEDLYLYYLDGNKVNLENSACPVIKDGKSHWCYFDLEHNSTFLLSGKELKSPLSKRIVKLSKNSYVYNGKLKKPAVTIKGLKKGKDYTVTYKNNKKVGQATVTIKGKGKYCGTITKSFEIVPKSTYITSKSGTKKAFTVKWKKQMKQTTGYQICYSTSSKFSKSKTKYVNIKSSKKMSKKITKLKGGKKYYVKIRTYKKINGKYYYSAWSKYKTVTTKK